MTRLEELANYERQGLLSHDVAEGVRAVLLTQERYEQIIADGVRDHHDFYIGAIGCITAVLGKPDCTVDEIRTIVRVMHAARDRWLERRREEQAVPTHVDGWAINGRAR